MENGFRFTLTQREDFQFAVAFADDLPVLLTDEPAPLGQGSGPNPSRLLAAGVANCLAASLLFALRKYKDPVQGLRADVSGELQRNEQGRWRIGHIDVVLHLSQTADALPHLQRALAQFEDFCVVTQSVRQGIDVRVQVRDGSGMTVIPQ